MIGLSEWPRYYEDMNISNLPASLSTHCRCRRNA
ncbi:hypothetical protein J2T57_003509 [Natronocella acetinitrilica]|uniref:Uncharacterized protein n=1 Tax=Natronocella acetinitrilica TaxID=414046 RepID=A0AAE3G8E5_9GAMM|nr:hypothetical protein [Natronocella acetinitrilica]